MDCQTATSVYNHQEGIIAGIMQQMPGVMEYLEQQVKGFVERQQDQFDTSVKALTSIDGFRVTHRDDDSKLSIWVHDVLGDESTRKFLNRYFSFKYDAQVFLGNICCSGCIVSDRDMPIEQCLEIQKAAISLQ